MSSARIAPPEMISRHDSPPVLRNRQHAWRERAPQHLDCLVGLGAAAHKNIDRCERALGPGVNRDVALSEKRDSGDASVKGEAVEVDLEEGRSRGLARST